MPMRRAADARVTINGVPFSVQRYAVRARSPRIDVSNTERIAGNPGLPIGAGAADARGRPTHGAAFIGDIPLAEIEITVATWNDAINPYIAPLLVRVGFWVTLAFFPVSPANRVFAPLPAGGFYGPWNCLVEDCSHEGIVGQGGQPWSARLVTDNESVLESL